MPVVFYYYKPSIGFSLVNMSFNIENFVAEPRLDEFNGLKKTDLLLLGQHYKLTVHLFMGKGDIKKLVLNYLVE